VTAQQLGDMDESARRAQLIPTEALFADLPALHLPAFYERLCRSGCEIYQKKIGTAHPVGARVRLCSEEGTFFALGEIREFDNGTAAKPIKLFDI
jgi:tRNA U55 pseudouridine synthase TruB